MRRERRPRSGCPHPTLPPPPPMSKPHGTHVDSSSHWSMNALGPATTLWDTGGGALRCTCSTFSRNSRIRWAKSWLQLLSDRATEGDKYRDGRTMQGDSEKTVARRKATNRWCGRLFRRRLAKCLPQFAQRNHVVQLLLKSRVLEAPRGEQQQLGCTAEGLEELSHGLPAKQRHLHQEVKEERVEGNGKQHTGQ